MKAFLLKVLIVKKSQKLCLFEKLISETWEGIWKHPFCTNMPLCGYGFHGKPVAWGQVNRQRLEKTMYVALS